MVTGLGQTFSGEGGWRTGAIRRVVRVLYRRATDANDLVIFQNPDDILDFVSAGYLADRNKARRIFGDGEPVSLEEGIDRMAAWARRAGARESSTFSEIEIERNMPPSWRR